MKNSNEAFKDVVCGMMVGSDEISTDYQGCHYAFCSNQCLERFKSSPHLYIGFPGSEAPGHAGVEILKKRRLKLSESLTHETENRVIECLTSMMGIKQVEIEDDRITIIYDLMQATEAQIEQAICASNIVLGDDLMEKIRRAFVHNMEETEIESMEARPVSSHSHHH